MLDREGAEAPPVLGCQGDDRQVADELAGQARRVSRMRARGGFRSGGLDDVRASVSAFARRFSSVAVTPRQRARAPTMARMRTITGLDELKQAEGEELGVSDWHEVSQKDIDAFADATGDHQWIHVDPERAKDTPFGGTIAHGYYTLSLAPMLTDEVLAMDGFAFAVNYGLNKVRFPAPVPVDSKVRMRAKLAELEEIPGGAQMIMELTFEREGGEKPVCVANTVVRVYEG
jgi:acyl dehydratase